RRYRAQRLEGIRQKSSRPNRCPHKTSPEWEERIILERVKHSSWGPKKIRELLRRKGLDGRVPQASTIGDILRRAGLVSRHRRRGRKTYYSGPLTEDMYTNHVCAVVSKGGVRTGE